MKNFTTPNQNTFIKVLAILATVVLNQNVLVGQSQLPECQSTVPFFTLDLSSNPDSTYTTPEITRNGQCCGDDNNQNYVSFYVTLHPDVAMVEIGIAPGYADPGGSGFYNIISGGDLSTPGACGTDIAGGQTACITGEGPHKITYHKPGSNKVKYYLRQIPKPIFPEDATTRIGCSYPMNIYGLESIVIRSINSSSGEITPGVFNSLLSCTDCSTPSFTPGLTTPEWIDYEICGSPIASVCGVYASCDTIRLYTRQALGASVSPNPATFCQGGAGVDLTAAGTGGDMNYSYTWRNSSSSIVSTGNAYTASSQGTYTVEVADGLNSPTCPSYYLSVPVTESEPPIVNAGIDQTVCAQSPDVFLTGSVENATGGIWSGGSGTFDPDANALLTIYSPSASEINAGFVTLTLTSTGAGGGCTNASDEVTIFFSDTVVINPLFSPIQCTNESTVLDANVSGGTAPYTYSWSTGSTNSLLSVTAGTYGLLVEDQYGCSQYTTVLVTEPEQLTIELSSNPTSDPNPAVCDGNATVSINFGTPPYSILWSNGETTTTATGLCYGIHTVTVTDANGCVVEGSTVVSNPLCSSLDAQIISKSDVSCHDGSDGEATVQASGGDGNYTYQWNSTPSQTTATATNLESGVYEVTVTDGSGCQSIAMTTIYQPTVINNYIISSNATSIGGNDGSATANPSGGTPPYSYLWNPTGQIMQTADNLLSNTYYLTISDDNGCLKEDSVFISQPPCNNFTLGISRTNVSCNGAADGTAYLLIAYGTAPYTITWFKEGVSFASNTVSVSDLSSGDYTVEVTDASNCTTFRNFTIVEPNTLSIGLTPTNISCYGADDGTIDLSISGGTYPYSFEWYRGLTLIANHEDLSNLPPGTYSVTVTDANGCSASSSVGIMEPLALQLATSSTDITCFGYSDGTLNANASGGTTPYYFAWTGPGGFNSTVSSLTGLETGLYQIQITDGNFCNLNSVVEVYINEPQQVEIDSFSIACPIPGSSTTEVEAISIHGGDGGPYQLSFDNGATYQSPGDYTSTLEVGFTYFVTVIDNNGCSSDSPYEMGVNPAVEITTISFDPCIPEGVSQIPVSITVSGGTEGNYAISLDGGSTYETAGIYTFNLNSNTSYSIVARDSNSCISLPYEIVIPAEIVLAPTLSSEVSCIGESDGEISLSVTGGTPTYSFFWSGPDSFSATTQNITNLSAGNYTITVTDQNNCVKSTSIEVTTFPDVTVPEIVCPTAIVVNNDPGVCGAVVNYSEPIGTDNCPGASTLLTQGMSDGSVFPVGITNVSYEVTDLAGNSSDCSFTITVIDNEPPVLLCPEDINTFAEEGKCSVSSLNVDLGSPVASDNCTLNALSNNAPASFSVGTTIVTWTAEDNHGNISTCEQHVLVSDTQVPVILSCGNSGDVVVTSDPGICTYTHSSSSWDALATDNCINIVLEVELTGATVYSGNTLNGIVFNPGLTQVVWTVTDDAGNSSSCEYTVTVKDEEAPVLINCIDSDQIVTTNPDECSYTVAGNAWDATASDNCSVASITTELSGATIASGLNSLDGVTFNIGTTIVTWTVTDGSGNSVQCIFDVIVEDNQLPELINCVRSDQSVTTDPDECSYTVSGNAWDATASDNCSIASITAELSGATIASGLNALDGVTFNIGTTIVTWTVTDGSGNSVQCIFDVIVEDNQLPELINCVRSDQSVTTDPDECSYTVSGNAWDATASDNCSIASITAELSGATIASGLNALDGVTFNIGTTIVTWTVTDGSGNSVQCVFDVIVEDNQLPEIVDCPSAISVNTDNGSCGAIVNWDEPTVIDNCANASISGSHSPGVFFEPGITTVMYTAIDAAGNETFCSFTIEVIDNELPEISCNAPIFSCDPVVTYSEPVASDNCEIATITRTSGLASGSTFPVGTTTITYEAVDISGNVSTCSFTVTIHPLPEPVISSEDVSCYDFEDGSMDLTVNNGTTPYTYAWSNGSDSEDLSGLSPGTYSVIVTDANGCLGTASGTISQPDQLTLASEIMPVLCNGGNSGAIQTEVSGGTLPYAFQWSNGATSQNVNDLNAGIYSLSVTDANGCSFEFTGEVTEPTELIIQSQVTSATCEASNGFIATQVSGGVAPYSYAWSNGSSEINLTDVPSGEYSLTVTDANGCQRTINLSISSESNLLASIQGENVNCSGRNNGSATVTVLNGNAPYSYQWSNGETESAIGGLSPGIYTVSVSDTYGCTVDLSIVISEPEYLDLELDPSLYNSAFNVFPYGNDNGYIDAFVYGGTAPYYYSWSTGDSSSSITGLPAGEYSLTVTDMNGCSRFASVLLIQPDILEMPNGYSPNGDSKNDFFVIRGLESYPSNEFTIYNRWGNIVYQRSNYDNTWNGDNNRGETLPDATYFVILHVKSADGTITLKGYVDLRR